MDHNRTQRKDFHLARAPWRRLLAAAALSLPLLGAEGALAAPPAKAAPPGKAAPAPVAKGAVPPGKATAWKLKALKKGELKANWERRQKRLADSRAQSAADLKARAEARRAKWKNATAAQKAAWKAKRAAGLAAAGGGKAAGAAVNTAGKVPPKGRHLRAAARAKRKGAELSKIE